MEKYVYSLYFISIFYAINYIKVLVIFTKKLKLKIEFSKNFSKYEQAFLKIVVNLCN